MPQDIESSTPLEYAKHSVRIQADGVLALQSVLNQTFINAAEAIRNVKGKTIVSGIGKSGYVAQKFSALLSSTGSPAFFLHPAEASHGDLGTISVNDLLVIFSDSGNTKELYYIIDHAKLLGIKIMVITRNEKGKFAQEADISIVLPRIREACDIAAPTTSCTMMMVYSDALAIYIYKANSFTAQDYRLLHPAGAIGYRLRMVGEVMHRGSELPLISTGSTISSAIVEITVKRLGCVGVIDDKKQLIGIITDGDLRRISGFENLWKMKVEEIMTANPTVFKENELISAVIHKMNKLYITNGFITSEENKPIGIVHIHDLLKIAL